MNAQPRAAIRGSAGVSAVPEPLRDDLHQTMLLAGTQTLGGIDRTCLRRAAT